MEILFEEPFFSLNDQKYQKCKDEDWTKKRVAIIEKKRIGSLTPDEISDLLHIYQYGKPAAEVRANLHKVLIALFEHYNEE